MDFCTASSWLQKPATSAKKGSVISRLASLLWRGLCVAQQGADVDLQSLCEALQAAQRRHGLAILNLGNVRAWHAHAAGELALAQVADAAQIAHGLGDLKTTIFAGCGGRYQG